MKPKMNIRLWHRRLSLVVGMQLFLWTLSGAYFAWFHIDNVHGDYERNFLQPHSISILPEDIPINSIIKNSELSEIKAIKIAYLLDRIVVKLYQNKDKVEIADAHSGEILSPITKEQAQMIAENDFKPKSKIISITEVNQKKGEYKGPIPAFRVSFDHPKKTNIYIHTLSGEITARRNQVWRGFDFLWMFHILDFENRENMNNWLLKIFSILALITVLSGYLLWMTIYKKRRKHKKKSF